MDLIEAIETRRSVRRFLPTPIPEELLCKVLAAANRSPSYKNTQPWEVAVVTGAKCDELRRTLFGLASAGAPSDSEMPAASSWPATIAARSADHTARRFATLGIARDDEATKQRFRLSNYEFLGAPCVLFLFMDATLGQWSVFDMGLFAENVALAAHGLGLGTCLQASLTHYPDAVRDCLGIAPSKKLVLGISIGYEDADSRINSYHSTRRALDEFVTWHR